MSAPFQPQLLGLRLSPTIAMRRGEELVFQCAWCGLLAVQTNLASGPLAACPACGGGEWWHEELPVAGLREACAELREAVAELGRSEPVDDDEL